MRALLLAAGLGTRLRPLTDFKPKCLMPIRGRPLLDIWLQQLSQAGVEEFLINTHYLAQQVDANIAESPFKQRISIAYEKNLLGTAGTVIANANFFKKEDGLLIHADNYCLDRLTEFMSAHQTRPPHCLMTMMTFRTDSPSTCGIVELDSQNIVVQFHEKVPNPPSNLANGAIYCLSSQLIKMFTTTELRYATNFSTEVLPQLIGRIYAYETKEFFLDIGSPEAYQQANSYGTD
jgi:mannose-1-phosphate guanylyltransferase